VKRSTLALVVTLAGGAVALLGIGALVVVLVVNMVGASR
jgi:hypothetical protein